MPHVRLAPVLGGTLAGCGRFIYFNFNFNFKVKTVSPRASRLQASYFCRLQQK